MAKKKSKKKRKTPLQNRMANDMRSLAKIEKPKEKK